MYRCVFVCGLVYVSVHYVCMTIYDCVYGFVHLDVCICICCCVCDFVSSAFCLSAFLSVF